MGCVCIYIYIYFSYLRFKAITYLFENVATIVLCIHHCIEYYQFHIFKQTFPNKSPLEEEYQGSPR